MKTTIRYIFAHLLFVAVSAGLLAQTPSLTLLDLELDSYPVLSTNFFLNDETGAPIYNIVEGDFFITENGLPRSILSLTCPSPSSPIRLSSVLAIDVSGSMFNDDNIGIARSAAEAWVDALPLGYSECALVSFDHLSYLNLDFTIDREALRKSIDDLTPKGGTEYDAGLINAPAGAIRVAANGSHKRVVVFLTDGRSQGNESEIIRLANESEVTLYTIVLRAKAPEILKHLAEETGGNWFEEIKSREEAQNIYRAILRVAQGEKPCRLVWEGMPDCDPERTLSIEVPFHQTTWSGSYLLPAKVISRLNVEPAIVGFGKVPPGEKRDTTIRITAEGQPVRIEEIDGGVSGFSLLSTSRVLPVVLQPGESLDVVLQYRPQDSTLQFVRLGIASDACIKSEMLASAGWPGIRNSEKSLRLIRPNGGEVFPVGSEVLVEWEGVLKEDTVLLEYSIDGGGTWQMITDQGTGLQYQWSAPPTPSMRCLMRVRQVTANGERGVLIITTPEPLYAGAYSPEGAFVAVGGQEVDLYSVLDGSHVADIPGSFRSTLSLQFRPDGNDLLIGSGNLTSDLISWRTGIVQQSYGGDIRLSASRFSPDGSRIVSHSYADSVLIYETATAQELQRMTGHQLSGFTVDWSPDGEKVVSGGNDGLGILWDPETGVLIDSLRHPQQVNSTFFSPDGSTIITACHDSLVRVWDVDDGSLQFSISESARVSSARYSPDGTLIGIGLFSPTVKIRDASTGALIRELIGHQKDVLQVEFSPNGTHLLSVSLDGTARIWNLSSLPNQLDTSDAFWSIVEPQIELLGVDMGRVGFGDYRDSVVTGWICNRSGWSVAIDSITFVGTGFFSLVSGVPPYTISPNQCLPIEFRFTPRRIGSFQDSVIIHSGRARYSSFISGEGIIAPLRVDHTIIDFGQVVIGQQRDTLVDVVITNVGSVPIWIERTELSDPNISQFEIVEGGGAFGLNPGEFRSMTLRFKPTHKGRTTGSLVFHYDGAGNFFFGLPPGTAQLTGEGICPDVVDGARVFFPQEVQAETGEELSIPLIVESPQVFPDTTSHSYRVLISLNKTLLAPYDERELDLFYRSRTLSAVSRRVGWKKRYTWSFHLYCWTWRC